VNRNCQGAVSVTSDAVRQLIEPEGK